MPTVYHHSRVIDSFVVQCNGCICRTSYSIRNAHTSAPSVVMCQQPQQSHSSGPFAFTQPTFNTATMIVVHLVDLAYESEERCGFSRMQDGVTNAWVECCFMIVRLFTRVSSDHFLERTDARVKLVPTKQRNIRP